MIHSLRKEARRLAKANYRRSRDSGVDLKRDFNNTKPCELNFYKSTCPTVIRYREILADLQD